MCLWLRLAQIILLHFNYSWSSVEKKTNAKYWLSIMGSGSLLSGASLAKSSLIENVIQEAISSEEAEDNDWLRGRLAPLTTLH